MKDKIMHQTPFEGEREGSVKIAPLVLRRHHSPPRASPTPKPQSLVEYAEASLSVDIGRAVSTKDLPFPRLSEPKNLLWRGFDDSPLCDIEPEREGKCPKVDVGETGWNDSDVRGFLGRGRITGWSEGSTELRSGDLDHEG